MALTIEPFDSHKYNSSNFYCREESLDSYIRKQASQDLKRKIATIFVLIDSLDSNIIAYYTLSAYTVQIKELSQSFAKKLPRYPLLPATLLGRLAVDYRYQSQGFGELMLIDAFKKALSATTNVASLAVVTEALDAQAVRFYKKYGFQPFQNHPMKLYLPMKTIEELNLE